MTCPTFRILGHGMFKIGGLLSWFVRTANISFSVHQFNFVTKKRDYEKYFQATLFRQTKCSKEKRQRTDYRTYHYRPSCSPVQYQAGNKSGSLEREVRQGFRQNSRSRTYQFHAGKHSQHGTPATLNGWFKDWINIILTKRKTEVCHLLSFVHSFD